jgi:hypothetical protein
MAIVAQQKTNCKLNVHSVIRTKWNCCYSIARSSSGLILRSKCQSQCKMVDAIDIKNADVIWQVKEPFWYVPNHNIVTNRVVVVHTNRKAKASLVFHLSLTKIQQVKEPFWYVANHNIVRNRVVACHIYIYSSI